MYYLSKTQKTDALNGAFFCARFAYPPNSLSLCGPDKKRDLLYYSTSKNIDLGTGEILTQFSTLYPYLNLIANCNNIKDPLNEKVVEAYWLGNKLLFNIPLTNFRKHLSETLNLKKILTKKQLENILSKIPMGSFPHHSFHVLNVYKRTGYDNTNHTIQTMDACIINWGKVEKIGKDYVIVTTQPLIIKHDKLIFGPKIHRNLVSQGQKDILLNNLNIGDYISYHWGYFCQKLNSYQLRNLIYYSKLSISLANL